MNHGAEAKDCESPCVQAGAVNCENWGSRCYLILAPTESIAFSATTSDLPQEDTTLKFLMRCTKSDDEASLSVKDRFAKIISTQIRRKKGKAFND